MEVKEFLDKILELRGEFEFSVTSWLRTPKRNAMVGGKPNSKHLTGLGIDIVLDNTEDTEDYINSANEKGLIVVNEGDHLHTQTPKGT